MRNEPSRPSPVFRIAELVLTLGLGASLVIVAPRLWTTPAPARVIQPTAPPVSKPVIEPVPRVIEDAVVITRPASPSDPLRHVIIANRDGIKNCVQRWLLADHSAAALTVDLKLNIGISGRVKTVQSISDPRLRALDPCVRLVVSRWAFPPSHEAYGVDFALTMHTTGAD